MNEKEQIKRGERILERVVRARNEEGNAMDSDLSCKIRRVGRAMSPKGENYLAAGADLAEFLLSEEPICRGARLMLAELVLGELRRPPRKPTKTASNPDVVEAVGLYDRLISEGYPPTAAEHGVYEKLKIPRSTLGGYIKMVREREAAIERAKLGPVAAWRLPK